MANSVDPDQTAPSGAVWSGSTLFAYVILSDALVFEFLGHLPYLFSWSMPVLVVVFIYVLWPNNIACICLMPTRVLDWKIKSILFYSIHYTYRIQLNYHTYPYKHTVKQFCSLQIIACVLLSAYLWKHRLLVLIWFPQLFKWVYMSCIEIF